LAGEARRHRDGENLLQMLMTRRYVYSTIGSAARLAQIGVQENVNGLQ
jgi:hypothetical protein